MYPQVLDPCDPTNSQAEGWEGGAENLDTVHLKRGREVEKAAALLVIPTESKANGSKATWSPAHKIRDYKGSLMPWQRGAWVSGKTWLPAHF